MIAEVLKALQRVPTQFLIVLVVASALILFLPDGVAKILAVDDFRKTYGVFLGPTFVVTSAWLIARCVSAVAAPFRHRKNLKRLQRSLHSLTLEEKGYLAAFIEDGRTTIQAQINDGIVGGLSARGIVFRSSNAFDLVGGVPYNLQPWAREYLQANPDLVAGARARPRTIADEVQRGRW